MLETSESVTAAAWDAAQAATDDPAQQRVRRAGRRHRLLRRRGRRRQGLHPGARRDRLHLRARRPPLPAAGARPARPGRSLGGYAARLADLAADGRTPRAGRRPRRGRRAPATRCARRSQRIAALAEEERVRRSREPATWPRTGRRRYGLGAEPGRPAGHRPGARPRRRAATRPEDRRLGGADDPRARHRRAARALRRARPCAARSSGASCSASPAPAPTWPRCAPRRCGTRDGWRLSGQKVWTSLAERSDWGICLARTNPDAKQHAGITYFLVDMSSEGIDVRPLRELTGEAMFNEVFLDDVFVPDDCVVGEVDGGWKLARTTLANERVAMAGSRLGDSPERAVSLLSPGATDDAGRRSAARSRWRPWSRCSAPAPRCGRWRARARVRSRAWPSWSAYAAARTPPSSSSRCSGTGSSLATTCPRGAARAADHPLPLHRRRHHAGAAQRGGSGSSGYPAAEVAPARRGTNAGGGAAASAPRPGSRGGCGSSRRPRTRAGCPGTPRRSPSPSTRPSASRRTRAPGGRRPGSRWRRAARRSRGVGGDVRERRGRHEVLQVGRPGPS